MCTARCVPCVKTEAEECNHRRSSDYIPGVSGNQPVQTDGSHVRADDWRGQCSRPNLRIKCEASKSKSIKINIAITEMINHFHSDFR